jgi:glucose dehydrogenase
VWPGRGPSGISGSHDFRDGSFRREHSGWLLRIKNNSHLHEITDRLMAQGVEPPLLDAAIRDAVSREVEIEASIEQLADPENGISLDWEKRDSAGQPRIRLHYSLGEYEEKGLAHIRETFDRIARRLNAKMLYIRGPFTEHHQMGMAVMGKDPKSSVVDPACRSHEHRNLFVIGSAVFPSGGCANPTITIAALALRAAREISKQLKG